MKTCPNCGEIKPFESFYRQRAAKDGHSSWCKECSHKKSAEQARQQRKRTGPSPYWLRDPNTYSRRVCLHLADYAERAIQRFEKNTHQEAPPQLVAIASIARQTADQLKPQPQIPRLPPIHLRVCPSCGQEFTTKNKLKAHCSELCARRMAGSRRRERIRFGISGPHRCVDCNRPIQRPGRCWGCHLLSGEVGRPTKDHRLTPSEPIGTLPPAKT